MVDVRFLDRLIRQPSATAPPEQVPAPKGTRAQFGYLGDAFYEIATSPSGRYALGWRDATDDGSRGGWRESGLGAYVLNDGPRTILQGNLERPNDGHVADSGRFIL